MQSVTHFRILDLLIKPGTVFFYTVYYMVFFLALHPFMLVKDLILGIEDTLTCLGSNLITFHSLGTMWPLWVQRFPIEFNNLALHCVSIFWILAIIFPPLTQGCHNFKIIFIHNNCTIYFVLLLKMCRSERLTDNTQT